MSDLAELFLTDERLAGKRALQELLNDLPIGLGRRDTATMLAFLHLTAGHDLCVELHSDEAGNLTLSLKKAN
ncbi:hypothetical protein U0C82_16480 [Fulvimarina sp. 2208YS6-2-32]|uniref:Uncharacterized protein n=1 Tax=Fulvimarina uroteuthidis TaxID=3098149 RepID=A0ABU5I6J3_9HYPH|nr:hypothetical protein [Fulvimarina sp. 2208YS6-2-32]MDY8110740.1 hypothetical protein [Fulvimarina sp. 2208YS6-2-32]